MHSRTNECSRTLDIQTNPLKVKSVFRGFQNEKPIAKQQKNWQHAVGKLFVSFKKRCQNMRFAWKMFGSIDENNENWEVLQCFGFAGIVFLDVEPFQCFSMTPGPEKKST